MLCVTHLVCHQWHTNSICIALAWHTLYKKQDTHFKVHEFQEDRQKKTKKDKTAKLSKININFIFLH